MGIDWSDVEETYAELLKARAQGQTPTLMRLGEMRLCISEAIDAHVSQCVVVDRYSWQRIGDALGVTRQAASKRWSRRVSRATDRQAVVDARLQTEPGYRPVSRW